jgi:hypothetical protein
MVSAMLLPKLSGAGGNHRGSVLGSAMLGIVLVVAAVCCVVGIVLAQPATSDTELLGMKGHRVGDVLNHLNHKLAIHASVGGFVISGDLKPDLQSL